MAHEIINSESQVAHVRNKKRIAFVGAGLSAAIGLGSQYTHLPDLVFHAGFAGYLAFTVRYIAKDRELDRLDPHL